MSAPTPLVADLTTRTAVGAFWRCGVMLLVACAATFAGAWIDSKIVVPSRELATLPSNLVALAVGPTAVL
ncbi:hypothetical protein [Streptomyces sp. 8N616]|uniref:hypothetical protein n=1 Tax=Streptomyces sp. 8N616 TaxID=3457414 RepID=UPI003FD59350